MAAPQDLLVRTWFSNSVHGTALLKKLWLVKLHKCHIPSPLKLTTKLLQGTGFGDSVKWFYLILRKWTSHLQLLQFDKQPENLPIWYSKILVYDACKKALALPPIGKPKLQEDTF